jgi:hypothetical protein
MSAYNIEKLWKQLLFYGEYTAGTIVVNVKKFFFYVDASQYDPEGLLFHIHRNFLNFVNTDGSPEQFSPVAFDSDPQRWFSRAIQASFQQYIWETTRHTPLINNSSILVGKEYSYDLERVLFTKCGLKFVKIHHQSLKKLTPYPQALEIW